MSVPLAESVPYVQTAEPTVVPAVVAPAEPIDGGDGANEDNEEGPNDTAEEKRLKRMRRNRESAAQSRNRKKQYVDSLESEIRQLKTTISGLTSENYELKKEQARMQGLPPPPPPEPIAMLAPVDVAIANASADGDDGQPPIAVATAHATVAPAVAAPSPRKLLGADALLGLELLSRSASINGETKSEVADAESSAMDAEDGGASGDPPPKAPEEIPTGQAMAGSQSGASSTSSMAMGAWSKPPPPRPRPPLSPPRALHHPRALSPARRVLRPEVPLSLTHAFIAHPAPPRPRVRVCARCRPNEPVVGGTTRRPPPIWPHGWPAAVGCRAHPWKSLTKDTYSLLGRELPGRELPSG